MDFLSQVKKKAKQLNKRILLPEPFDVRVLKAVEIVQKEKTASISLIGKRSEIEQNAFKNNIHINFIDIDIIDNKDPRIISEYSEILYEQRKEKGLTKEEAEKLIAEDVNYAAVIALFQNKVDGIVSGATKSTAETIKPALQIIKTKEKFHKVSGIFFMIMEKRLLLFADCAINIEPDSHELADIAIDTAETAIRFGIKPKIAMLSFSTNGSAKHPKVDEVQEAVQMVKHRRPDLFIEGEMQVDAALVPDVCKLKFPTSLIKGQANVLIFPDLQSGNIAYKLVERLAGAIAIGPLLQGLKKPVNDLSRGCNAQNIADLVAFTACESEELNYNFELNSPSKQLAI
jgi:phosphate acetyltransferase